MNVLITGGVGFVGSHVSDALIEEGHNVILLDNLSGTDSKKPTYLNARATLIVGDVRDEKLIAELVSKVDVVFHFAAKVGIAQSNYQIKEFVGNNCVGTAELLEAIVGVQKRPKLIVAASNTSYGEGLYACTKCNAEFHPAIRSQSDVNEHGMDPICPKCSSKAKPIPTKEDTPLDTNSIYALTKKFQEETALMIGRMYEFPVIALKFFNIFGPRQSLSNPYTGVSAIFTSRIKNDNPVVIYEDGKQTRDFIYIKDVVRACIMAMKESAINYEVINIGSGKPTTIYDLAKILYSILGKEERIEISNIYRKGDIRHCIADISKANLMLGWKPETDFELGIREMLEWAQKEKAEDRFEQAQNELRDKKLI